MYLEASRFRLRGGKNQAAAPSSSTYFFVAGAIESAGSRSGIIIACVAW
ncbi:hypothetical protein PG2093B_0149 [Bifidobacterium pseudolongum subsp. globosum]|uniref:Uncharacterized protein n=1 Tax=Bifidobacterium pseudolongum subsp. globosum TaxID=1690 RepID=A0A4Q5A461_9BIFI|nr:hypothetical protein PG2093B_0149 [Bifidobacterium pseudolongum subsp. globosum]